MRTGQIKVENLSISHGDHAILQQISLTVTSGETFAIIGESGGGKTTLARCLCGLMQDCHGYHLSGRAMVNDIDVLTAKASDMRPFRGTEIGLISQALSDALNPHMTLLEHIQEILAQHRIKPADPGQICTEFNLPARLHHRYPYQLSGGEIQRLLTALALITNPPCLILDEPTAALDQQNKEYAIATFQQGSDKRAQILITHDLSLAEKIADRVGVLHQGCLVEVGATDSLFQAPAHPYTQSLLHSLRKSATHRNTHKICKSAQDSTVGDSIGPNSQGLCLSGICYHYRHQSLFQNISAFIPAGHCLAILGPSGCGKSTMARLLSGYLESQKGHISWHPASDQKPAAMACLISQHPHRALAPHFSVQDVLTEALMFGRKQKSPNPQISMTDLLAQVGLPTDSAFLKRKTKILSGGEAQRLVIARALLASPKYLVADEPTSALDLASCDRIIHLLRNLIQTRHISLILFTHDLAVARQLGDQYCQLSQDRLAPLCF